MGLDMYLYAQRRLTKFDNDENLKKKTQIKQLFPEMFDSGNLETISIKFEAGYWRKANAIHKWFVDTCSDDGEDTCKDIDVSRENLVKLKELCVKTVEILSKAELKDEVYQLNEDDILLPTAEGFFFGSTEYDEYYLEDIKRTIDIINKCLELPSEWYFIYVASW